MKNKIICAVTALVIIAGIVVTCTLGLNVSLMYSAHKQVDIKINQEFDNNEIKSIAKEVLADREVVVEKVEVYEDMVSISAKDISDEELESIITKINEKYGTENTKEKVDLFSVPNIKLTDLVKPYITPVIISFVLVLIYATVYTLISNKLGKKRSLVKVLLITIASIVGVQGLLLAVYAISRLPINNLTMPISVTLYVLSTIGLMIYVEGKYKTEEKKKKKSK